MDEEDSASGLYWPHMEARDQGFHDTVRTVGLPSGEECEPIHDMDDSQLVGAAADADRGFAVADGDSPSTADVDTTMEPMLKESGGGKRKRGRPPKGEVKSLSLKNKKEEEDVCFICFDGGSLVLCDRRGCPKAYHPSCIKRDEAFFKSKARWNCGWHICSSCQKAAHYMCYTCTYSLCKGCTKDADYLCVRGNMGFCMTCMRTIMLIENQQGNKETAQVDFDDKSSWEYLFKVYWIYLKGKLSLTLNELTQAKSPWKGAVTTGCQGQSLDLHCGANDGKGSISDSSSGCLESNSYKRRKTEEQPNLLDKDPVAMEKSSSDKGITSEWASKELLEFVAHMRNGDTSVLSQFDVQNLLLEYIKINNLRDPRRKSQIICDLRLRSIFGKPRVGHIEMLKLLEFHFLTEEDSRKDTVVRGNFVDVVVGQVEIDENNGNLLVMGKNKRRKNRKKGEERGPQTNLDDYAAIDVHNINLIFLRRNLMEILIEDKEFNDKVVGSIVRIRISSSDQKQEMYRLVQVVGTSKVAVPYKLGEKTSDVMLEILNLDKKEAILIDTISNQEFSEIGGSNAHTTGLNGWHKDECQRLRQSIKCGLVKRFTVGNIQEKAMALRALKLNEWLDIEILRLNHLRDRASEKGHKKELRECVEKLQLLKTPEERQRRLQEIPEVHADPNMDPNYESEEEVGENNKKQDKYVRSKYSAFSRHGKGSISPKKGGDVSNDNGGKAWKNSSICGQNRKICTTFYQGKGGPTCNERKDAYGSNGSEKQGNQVDTAASAIDTQVVLRSRLFSGVASETSSAALSTEKAASINNNETDKLWHYRDPNGKIQGPFCMVQLRKWSTTGYFPPDMRIWDINHKENESVLLADVLNGQFQAILPSLQEISLQSQEVEGASDGRLYRCSGRWSGNMNISGINSKQSEGSGGSNDGKPNSNGNNEFMRSNVWRSQSPNRTKPAVSYIDVQAGSSSQCWDSINGNNSCSDQPQGHSHLPSLTLSDHQYGTPSHQGLCLERERWNSEPNHGNLSSHETGVFQTTCGQGSDNPSNYLAHSGQSSGQNWKPENSSSNWNSSSSFTSVAKSNDSLEQNSEIDTLNLPSPTPKTTNGDGEGQASENKQLMLLNVPNQDSHIPDLPSPTPKSSSRDEKCQGVENKQSVSSKLLVVPDSGPSWSSSSSLVVGSGAQVPEMADEWGRYSPTPVKPSIVELDVGLVSSSVKAPDAVGDHAASPTSKSEQLTYSSPSQPTSNASSWQAIVAEPIEFSTLAEESVSDLLAQVDALESQCGLGSPTSVMNCVGEVIPGSRNDCFGSIEGLSPTPDPGKSDALSSTGDVQLPSQSTVRVEPVGPARGDVLDSVKSSSGQSFTKAEVNGETKPGDVPFNCFEAGSNIQPHEPSPACQNVTAGLARSEAMDTGLETVKRNADSAWGGPAQRSTCSSWGTNPGTVPLGMGNVNVSRGGAGASTGWEEQPKHGGDRITGSRNSAFHGGNPGLGRGRLSWGWQSSLVGGGYARPPPKGQRVCKFYEHGHCKKGASCDYLHP